MLPFAYALKLEIVYFLVFRRDPYSRGPFAKLIERTYTPDRFMNAKFHISGNH